MLYVLIVVQALLTTSEHFLSHWPGIEKQYGKKGFFALTALSVIVCVFALYSAHKDHQESQAFQNSVTGGDSAPLALPENAITPTRLMILNIGSSSLPEVGVGIQDSNSPTTMATNQNVGPIPIGAWLPFSDKYRLEFPVIGNPASGTITKVITMTTRNSVFTEVLDLVSYVCEDKSIPKLAYQYKVFKGDSPTKADVPFIETRITQDCGR
jgi:hypothetical protein